MTKDRAYHVYMMDGDDVGQRLFTGTYEQCLDHMRYLFRGRLCADQVTLIHQGRHSSWGVS